MNEPISHIDSELQLLRNFTIARHKHGKGKGATVVLKLSIYPGGWMELRDGSEQAAHPRKGEPYRNDHGQAWDNLVAALRLLYDRAVEDTSTYQEDGCGGASSE